MNIQQTNAEKSSNSRQRILVFAETVTLAHAARPAVLASALDPGTYDVCLAWDPRYSRLFPNLACRQRPIQSISSQQFLEALAKGKPVYDVATLRHYVREDSQVLDEFRPDVVVGDFRLSLAVSARMAKVPYVAICNAYWSPHARQTFPMPELPFLRFTGLKLGELLFRMVRPVAFSLHCRPLNQVCRECGIPETGFDLRRVYTEGDYVVYCDLPELAPTYNLPASHTYLGPIQWSPDVELPDWWDRIPAGKQIIYVTFGSSGASGLLPRIFRAVEDLPVIVLVATAGRYIAKDKPANVFMADYLPGDQAAERSSLVICNGGSPTTYQALATATPVLGIASNMDQFLNMQGIERFGAGHLLRADTASVDTIRLVVRALLETDVYQQRAREIASRIGETRPIDRFRQLLRKLVLAT